MKPYNRDHRATREALLPAAIGTRCPLCGFEMRIGQALDLDHSTPLHTDPDSVGDRIVHAECNRREGGRVGKGQRRDRECEVCGATYSPSYNRQATCGRRMCVTAWRRMKNPPLPPVEKRPYQFTCQTCGTVKEGHPLRLDCSDACQRERLRAKRPQMSGTYEWPCEQCGGPVERLPRQGRSPKRCVACRISKKVSPAYRIEYARKHRR